MTGEPLREIYGEGGPSNDVEAAEQFAAAARGLLAAANETVALIGRAREETRRALENLEARLALSSVRGETRTALENLEAHLASTPLRNEQVSVLPEVQSAPEPPQTPAVPIRKSVTRDYLICLEDGKKLKMLRRHLRSEYNMTPDDYRAKWGLSADYPMVAPSYAEQRSAVAKALGLGRNLPRKIKSRTA